MKRTLFALTGLVVTVLMSACSTVRYTTDMDNTIDFTGFKTFEYYGWAEESNKILNQLQQERIEKAFGEELRKRNLQYVEEDGDLIVTLYVVTENKTRTSATTTNMGGYTVTYGYGGWYGYGPAYGWSGGSSHTTFDEYEYTVGTLVIDIYDAKEKRLIFEAIAQGETHDNPKGMEERMKKIAAKMMREYPVEPAK